MIDAAELKAYRAEIEARPRSLLAEHANRQAQLEALGQAIEHVEVLIDYCERARQPLHTFEHAEKPVAFEALDIYVSWIPGVPLMIRANIDIPSTEIAQSSLRGTSWLDVTGAEGSAPAPRQILTSTPQPHTLTPVRASLEANLTLDI